VSGRTRAAKNARVLPIERPKNSLVSIAGDEPLTLGMNGTLVLKTALIPPDGGFGIQRALQVPDVGDLTR
jgi:hypothetical protein